MEKQQTVCGPNVEHMFATFVAKTRANIREELDEHLEAINNNTNEIQSNFEYLQELDKKVEKLSEKMDEILMVLKGSSEQKSFEVKELTKREKQVFQAFYTLIHDHPEGVTYVQIAHKLGISTGLVANFVTNLLEKGVPVKKVYHNNNVHLLLDEEFSQLQAKENVLGINSLLSAWIR